MVTDPAASHHESKSLREEQGTAATESPEGFLLPSPAIINLKFSRRKIIINRSKQPSADHFFVAKGFAGEPFETKWVHASVPSAVKNNTAVMHGVRAQSPETAPNSITRQLCTNVGPPERNSPAA